MTQAALREVATTTLPAPAEDVVTFSSISKTFASTAGQVQAVDTVSLTVRKGEFISFVGPSGCGKTTLLNLVAGLVAPDAGEVRYSGELVRAANTRVGYLTQHDALLPWRSVLSNVALPLEIKGVGREERRARSKAIINQVGLGGFESHLPSQLSGGMRKRVSLARTLVYRPETLLLDEPFSALDAQMRVLLQRQLRDLVRELGLTVLLVTHDLAEAIALSDRIAVFSRRPARVLDILDVPPSPTRDVLRRAPGDDELQAAIWSQLADQIDIESA